MPQQNPSWHFIVTDHSIGKSVTGRGGFTTQLLAQFAEAVQFMSGEFSDGSPNIEEQAIFFLLHTLGEYYCDGHEDMAKYVKTYIDANCKVDTTISFGPQAPEASLTPAAS